MGGLGSEPSWQRATDVALAQLGLTHKIQGLESKLTAKHLM